MDGLSNPFYTLTQLCVANRVKLIVVQAYIIRTCLARAVNMIGLIIDCHDRQFHRFFAQADEPCTEPASQVDKLLELIFLCFDIGHRMVTHDVQAGKQLAGVRGQDVSHKARGCHCPECPFELYFSARTPGQ